MMMTVCPKHNRWTYIKNADGSEARRPCPECHKVRAGGQSDSLTAEETKAALRIRVGHLDAHLDDE